eukprot:1301640-Amorphochlora_amoeboformis.AAC.2
MASDTGGHLQTGHIPNPVMPRVDAKGRDHGSFVLPANDPDGYNESFGRPEDVCDLTSLYLRHNKLKSKKIMGLAVSDNELGEVGIPDCLSIVGWFRRDIFPNGFVGFVCYPAHQGYA